VQCNKSCDGADGIDPTCARHHPTGVGIGHAAAFIILVVGVGDENIFVDSIGANLHSA
jgi:hypothetical protein